MNKREEFRQLNGRLIEDLCRISDEVLAAHNVSGRESPDKRKRITGDPTSSPAARPEAKSKPGNVVPWPRSENADRSK
jgi:hypothetical protein